MPTDIFPDIDIPVISVVWNYSGLPPEEMEKRIVTNYERALTTTVNDIEHIESQSLTGIAVIKIFFQPGAKIEAATAQVTAISQTVVRADAAGHDAAVHHPLQRVERAHPAGRARERLAERAAALRLRDQLHPRRHRDHPRRAAPLALRRQAAPDHGRHRSAAALRLGPLAARREQRRWPAERDRADGHGQDGRQRVSRSSSTASPALLDEIESIPIKVVHGTTVYVRDVANVRDGYAPQTNMVHVEGKKSVLMSILKHGSASTLDVVEAHPRRAARDDGAAAEGAQGDACSSISRSSCARRSSGVVKEARIAAGLTALMILLFLGSWRSTLIVVVSIPLSILVSIIVALVRSARRST